MDGVLQGATPFTTPFNNTRVLNIGFAAGGGAPQRFFRGSVDEFGIYSRALSASEIQAIFNTGSSGNCKPFSVLVDPKAAYLYTNSDSPASPTIMNLAASGFAPGDMLKISYAVAPPGFSFYSCSGPFLGASQFPLLGVFSSSNTLLATSASHRVPGAIDAGPDYVSLPTYYGNQLTDIPEDFWVTPPGGFTIQIPSGVTHLFLGIGDSLYYDNCGTIKVTIERVNQPPAAGCQNVTVSSGANCAASASIDNGSFDPDGDSITITQSPAGPYPLGDTLVTLAVTDSNGASRQCTATVSDVAPFYLRGTGPNNNPPTLFLDAIATTAATAKFKDSTAINFSGGNPWKEVGEWPAAPSLISGSLTAVNDLRLWLGLRRQKGQKRQKLFASFVLFAFFASKKPYAVTLKIVMWACRKLRLWTIFALTVKIKILNHRDFKDLEAYLQEGADETLHCSREDVAQSGARRKYAGPGNFCMLDRIFAR